MGRCAECNPVVCRDHDVPFLMPSTLRRHSVPSGRVRLNAKCNLISRILLLCSELKKLHESFGLRSVFCHVR